MLSHLGPFLMLKMFPLHMEETTSTEVHVTDELEVTLPGHEHSQSNFCLTQPRKHQK